MLQTKILKHINKLQQKKYRREHSEFVVEGVKGMVEAIESSAQVQRVIVQNNKKQEPEFIKIIDLAHKKHIVVDFCNDNDVGKIKDTDTFPGVLAIVKQIGYELDEIGGNSIICLDCIKDPGNLGAIIRTADWFGVNSVVLSEDCVDLYNPKTVRATMGSIFRVKVFQSKDLAKTLASLKKKGYQISGLTMNGKELKINKKIKTAYILGSESHGINPQVEKLLDKRYTIKGSGSAESLNVAITAGILLSKLHD
ncbi:MAG: RNA methyltransferase [bacterium]